MPLKKMPWLRLALAALMLLSTSAGAEWAVNMRPGVTAISREIYDLHMIIFWICVVIGIVVFGVMFWSVFAHRKSKGAQPAQFHESTTVELVWTTIPFLILIAMAIPATKVLISIYDTDESVIDIKITGYQWKWHYDYLNDGFGYFSNLQTSQDEIYNKTPKGEHYLLEVDEPLVVPVNTKVRFLVTANDVIHSWWVPALAVKKDAIPGFINEAWTIIDEPGVYRGQCAELCGKDHGFMPVVVVAKEQAEYDAWVAERKAAVAQESALQGKEWGMAELMERGEKTFATFCSACHGLDGNGVPPAFPPLKGSVIATGDKAAHIDIVLHGKAGTYMAAFGPQLSDTDLAAVITYERNSWGNDTGDVIQPSEIAAAKAEQ